MPILSPITVKLGQATSAGVKSVNEDCIGMLVPDTHVITTKGISAAISDGVGSASCAKEASEVSVRSFITDYYATPETWDVKHAVQKVLLSLNHWLYSQNTKYTGHGYSHLCTLSLLILKSNKAHIFHIGDSRIYRLRESQIEQLTRDHRCTINADNSYLNRAMGMDNFIDIDYCATDIQVGDLFFLCTDGVYQFVNIEKYFESWRHEANLDNFDLLASDIIELAVSNGSDDNVSCQLMRVEDLLEAHPDSLYSDINALRFPPELSAGDSFDGFKIIKEIHNSARSQLFLVENADSKKPFVLKTPSVNFEGDAAYIEQFTLEPWLANQVDNPYVIKSVQHENTSNNYLYYLMEHIGGVTLAEWYQTEHQDLESCKVVLEQIISGVRALHRKKIIHQDLKPDNIMIDEANNVKIIDLGSAFVGGVREVKVPFQRKNAMGTRRYSAPELFTDDHPTEKADMFSIACIFYEMLTNGHHPYGESYSEGSWRKSKIEPVYIPATQYNHAIPVWVDAAIGKACAFRQHHRYPALSEFLHDVKIPNHQLHIPRSRRMIEDTLWQSKRLVRMLIVSNVFTLLLLLAVMLSK